jgi:Lar family restriction alleviation protein
MTELKPCPFCGSEAVITCNPDDAKWFYIECGNENCPILVQGQWHTDMNEAKKEWNRRADNEKTRI